MPRLLFEKTGNAVWISHLDLMRVFQRAFKRAGLSLKHTQGFSPRPSVSIALPLSVGVESLCELLDFELEGKPVPFDEICTKLNEALISGVKVHKVYSDGRKIRDIAYLDCIMNLEYDKGVPENAARSITELFGREEVLVEKKNKNGTSEQNIIPMIRRIELQQPGDDRIELHARICCQNPTLNPMQLHAAITKYFPGLAPDHVACIRAEIYDQNEEIFR